MSAGDVAFVDTETLGLDADHHPIWEVAVIAPDGEEVELQVQVTPRELALAHPIALEIGRFEERYGKGPVQPLSPRIVAETVAAVLPDRVHLAGAVVSFDEERLRRLFWRFDLQPPWHYHLIDVETLAAGALRKFASDLSDGRAGLMAGAADIERQRVVATPPWDSEELSRALGVDPDRFDRHTALGDARWAKAIYEAVMGATP